MPLGQLRGKFFREGEQAGDRSDRVIYNPDSGKLFFDGNGNKPGGEAIMAKLAKHADLDASDFWVV